MYRQGLSRKIFQSWSDESTRRLIDIVDWIIKIECKFRTIDSSSFDSIIVNKDKLFVSKLIIDGIHSVISFYSCRFVEDRVKVNRSQRWHLILNCAINRFWSDLFTGHSFSFCSYLEYMNETLKSMMKNEKKSRENITEKPLSVMIDRWTPSQWLDFKRSHITCIIAIRMAMSILLLLRVLLPFDCAQYDDEQIITLCKLTRLKTSLRNLYSHQSKST